MEEVADAVILAGGRGTRMLPGSMYVPKETMPLVDTPIINHLIWESCNAGVKRIHIVIAPNKKNIMVKKLSEGIEELGLMRPDLPKDSLKPVPDDIKIFFYEQIKPGGVGDAISIVCLLYTSPSPRDS